MFYNCPVRKLASHSPPSCEKNHTHKHTHLQAQTHAPWHPRSLTHALPGTHIRTHTDSDTRPLPTPAGTMCSPLRREWDYQEGGRAASRRLHQSAGTCICTLGTWPSSLLCVLTWLWRLPLSGTGSTSSCCFCVRGGPAGTPFPQESHLKVQEFEGRLLIRASDPSLLAAQRVYQEARHCQGFILQNRLGGGC